MNLDRLDNNEGTNSDGIFDYVSGYTILPSSGRIIFPVVEPFGSHLEKAIGTPDASTYAYQELYDSTLTVAKQFADKTNSFSKENIRHHTVPRYISTHSTYPEARFGLRPAV